MGVGLRGTERAPQPSQFARIRRTMATLSNTLEFIDSDRGIAVDGEGYLIPGPGIAFWHKEIEVTYDQFTSGTGEADIELFELPAGGMIEMVKIKHTTAFGGGGVLNWTLSVGIASWLDKYSSKVPVDATPADDLYCIDFLPDSEDHASDVSIRVSAIGSGALSSATAGAANIWVKYGTIL